jgi:hypothetical protein
VTLQAAFAGKRACRNRNGKMRLSKPVRVACMAGMFGAVIGHVQPHRVQGCEFFLEFVGDGLHIRGFMTPKRVKLKEKSPEFAEGKAKPRAHACDMPGCPEAGEFRAPKDRGLQDYYHFCFQHVQEYNKAWDFFDGMSQADIEAQIKNAMFGDRPTWIYTSAPDWEETLRARAQSYRSFSEDEPHKKKEQAIPPVGQTPEREALLIMGLEPPVTFVKIKERYRTLMKEHHPDRNPNNKQAEEIVKKVNMAYTILKAAHEKYDKIRGD